MPTIEVLPTTDITIQYINEPKEGKKMGSVKAEDGQYYNVFPNMLAQFSKGMRCKVEYESRHSPDGKEWRTIKKIVGNGSAPTPGPKNDYRSRTNPADSKQIFVAGLVNNQARAGLIPVGDLETLITAVSTAMRAYDRTLGGVQAQRRDDLDDEIGF